MEKIALLWLNNTFWSISSCLKRSRPFLWRNHTFGFRFKLPIGEAGFTLIELITAIGVLSILATVGIVTLNPAEQFAKSADARRKADLVQIQRALEVYYQDYGSYPAMGTGTDANKICMEPANSPGGCITIINWGSDWKPYMDVLPIEQRNNKNYAYWTDSSGQSYALYASLDREGRDLQACNGGDVCLNAPARSISCGQICNYGITSPNIAP